MLVLCQVAQRYGSMRGMDKIHNQRELFRFIWQTNIAALQYWVQARITFPTRAHGRRRLRHDLDDSSSVQQREDSAALECDHREGAFVRTFGWMSSLKHKQSSRFFCLVKIVERWKLVEKSSTS